MKFKDLFPVLDCYRIQILGNNERLNAYGVMLFPMGNLCMAKHNIDFDAWLDCEVEEINACDKCSLEVVLDISHAYLDEPEPDYEELSPLKIVRIKLFPEKK